MENLGWPERFNPLPMVARIEAAGRFVGRLVRFLPLEAPAHMSNHYQPETGAEAFLEAKLEEEQLSFEDEGGRWDDMGCY